MGTSAPQRAARKVIALTKGATTAHVKIEIAAGAVVTASITNEAVEALGLAVGKKASASSRLPTSWSPSTDAVPPIRSAARRQAKRRIGRQPAGAEAQLAIAEAKSLLPPPGRPPFLSVDCQATRCAPRAPRRSPRALAGRRRTPASADGSPAKRSSAGAKRVSSETRVSPWTSLSAKETTAVLSRRPASKARLI